MSYKSTRQILQDYSIKKFIHKLKQHEQMSKVIVGLSYHKDIVFHYYIIGMPHRMDRDQTPFLFMRPYSLNFIH